MKLRQLYETLLAGNKVTLDLPSHDAFKSIYSQLRQLKSSLDKQFANLGTEPISEGKVIRYEIDSAHLTCTRVTFYLGEPKRTNTIPYQIISIVPLDPAVQVLEPESPDTAESSEANESSK